VTNDELEAIEMFLRRTGTLAPLRELELAQIAAPALARRIGVPIADPIRFLALLWYQARGRLGAPIEAAAGERRRGRHA
jgi:hypothetical protein